MMESFLDALFSLEGKTAIVTGAAGHLGRGFSETLLAASARVVLYGRGEKLSKFAESLRGRYGKKVNHFRVNFYDNNNFLKCLQAAGSEVDILVNNAYDFSEETGFNHPSGRMENMEKEKWMNGLEAGVCWAGLAIREVLGSMKRRKSGSIINVSSMYALVAPDPDLYEGTETFNPAHYGASKAGLIALTRYVASFYGKYNIRCNALVPGAFPNMEGKNRPAKGIMDKLKRKTVLGRVGLPNDLAGALIFLASDASSYMTGQSIVVDGGWTTK